MDCEPNTPVIVGAGQVVQRDGDRDPITLAVAALRRAGEDSGVGDTLLQRADSVCHVATVSWPYTDEAALIAGALGATPRETVRTVLGGDGPQRLFGDSAQRIADGEIDVALISGAEAFTAVKRADGRPGWPVQEDAAPTRVVGDDKKPLTEDEIAVGLIAPVTVYALFETALRGEAGRTPVDHRRHIAELWARCSRVAADNPFAWLPEVRSPQELATPTDRNRWVSSPYTKLLTANINVDQASGLIMCSAAAAEAAGVPRERWVFPWAGAHADDEWFFSHRGTLTASPAIRACGAALLEHTGLAIDDIAHVDLYSCFPAAVQIAARELGLGIDRPLTVTGGLTFAGGPANNYAGHSIAATVRLLREDPDAIGLTSALGWYVTKHALGLYSAKAPPVPYRDLAPAVESPPARDATAAYTGAATVEAYTVHYGATGPEAVILSALTLDGTRVLGKTSDPALLALAVDGDALAASVTFADSITLDTAEVPS